ncbi:MAG: hypothetical protein QXT63_07145, partial [Thermoplasmata archaeon]
MAVKAMSLAMEAERRAAAQAQTKKNEENKEKEKIKEKKKIEVKKPFSDFDKRELDENEKELTDNELEEEKIQASNQDSYDETSDIQKMLLQIKKAKDAIHKLRTQGANTEQAEKLLTLAESFAKEGNTEKAIKYAQKAENLASQVKLENDIMKKEEKTSATPLPKLDKKEVSKRICPKCNNELEQNWIGCPYCKTRLDYSNKEEIRIRLESTKSMLSLLEKLGEDVSDAKSKLNLAESFLRLGENDKALDYIIKAETNLNEKNRGV